MSIAVINGNVGLISNVVLRFDFTLGSFARPLVHRLCRSLCVVSHHW